MMTRLPKPEQNVPTGPVGMGGQNGQGGHGGLPFFFFSFNIHYSLLSFWLPQQIHNNLKALTITYSICCDFVELAEKFYNPVIFVRGERLSFTSAAANRVEHGTSVELLHIQTPALDRSAVWTKVGGLPIGH